MKVSATLQSADPINRGVPHLRHIHGADKVGNATDWAADLFAKVLYWDTENIQHFAIISQFQKQFADRKVLDGTVQEKPAFNLDEVNKFPK